MTEEEYFRKTYPDSCYGDKPLSPYWDFFQDGVEFGERQSEKKIEVLEKENAELRNNGFTVSAMTEQQLKVAIEKGEQLEKENADLRDNYDLFKASAIPEIERLKKENAELKVELKDANEKVVHLACNQNKDLKHQLTKAKEIIKELLDTQYQLDPYRDVFKTRVLKAEQFLEE